MLTIADGGGGVVQEPLILADVICEHPLMNRGDIAVKYLLSLEV